jgi:pimeloyl-ACP methyl ester carboxylesterase
MTSTEVAPAAGVEQVRTLGEGELLLLVHGGGMNSAAWMPAMRRLKARFRCVAPDLVAGLDGASYADRLQAGARQLQAVVQRLRPADGPLHVAAHSYGGAVVATWLGSAAVAVTSLILIEPTMPGLLGPAGQDAALAEMRGIYERCHQLVGEGDPIAGAQTWLTYWGGEGFWRQLPDSIRRQTADWLASLRREYWEASFDARWNLENLARCAGRKLVLCGDASPLPCRSTSEIVANAIGGRLVTMDGGLGHMSPLTHAQVIAERLEAALLTNGREDA